MAAPKVVILGGGFGGLNAAQQLGNTQYDVTVIDRTNHHLFQPLLYQVASAALSPADIAVPIREILSPYKNITVLMEEVTSIDKANRRVLFKTGQQLPFDHLIVALGARHSYFGHDEWEPFAPGLKTLYDALKLRDRILLSFEYAERSDSIAEAQSYLNFVIIGGGPTGVELAGAIAEIAYDVLLRDFRRIDTSKARIFLVEGSPHILPVYPETLSIKAQQYLERFGVEVLTDKRVTNVTAEGVHIGDTVIPARNIIWAAGNQASPILKSLDVPLDKQGRVLVGPDLTIPNSPDIFVIGDAANANNLPGLAPVAVQQGRYVASLLKKYRASPTRPPFQYFDKGSMATIGKRRAVGTFGKFQFSGFIAWFAWCFVHILYLIGFRNRITVLTQWLFSYFKGQRGARLLYRPLDKS